MVTDVTNDRNKEKGGVARRNESRLKKIKTEVDSYLKKLSDTKIPELVEVYESNISELVEERKELQMKNDTIIIDKLDVQTLFNQTKQIIKSPRTIWHNDSLELKRKMISVFFNNKIYYNKKIGFQTPDIPLIYRDLQQLNLQESQDLKISTKMLNSFQQEVYKHQYVFERIGTLLREKAFFTESYNG